MTDFKLVSILCFRPTNAQCNVNCRVAVDVFNYRYFKGLVSIKVLGFVTRSCFSLFEQIFYGLRSVVFSVIFTDCSDILGCLPCEFVQDRSASWEDIEGKLKLLLVIDVSKRKRLSPLDFVKNDPIQHCEAEFSDKSVRFTACI